ncbi:type II toxin-antitoxin system VapC family toxin [Sphingomonas sp. CFBP8993]|uniref:type II toxin-antitoxin system VapC family toxin n=1 Tax=Sphingomonas sp. CFBP8993 TaxID=3096526 RepID=UPI002A6B2B0E|nr:type II toxin-antitoxin system VapC family toxin [Sphingomonas sp. CFBP8993]MDY0958499.1 type II toxin-antitoxin system VapC family toxin [Sphingomonas sp. CFBP8993]
MIEPRYLLDSNICIYVLRDAGGRVAKQLTDCEPGSAVASAITYAEIMRGLEHHGAAAIAVFDRFFERVPILPFDQRAASAYATIPFRRGRFDRLIGAHALATGLTLVTNNEADFADIPGLTIENWTL